MSFLKTAIEGEFATGDREMASSEIEKGYKWWVRYVIVPLIGGGGLIAIVVALLTRTPPTTSGSPPTPVVIDTTVTLDTPTAAPAPPTDTPVPTLPTDTPVLLTTTPIPTSPTPVRTKTRVPSPTPEPPTLVPAQTPVPMFTYTLSPSPTPTPTLTATPLPLVATVIDTSGKAYKVTDLKARYAGDAPWTLTLRSLVIDFVVQEDHITAPGKRDIPLASIRRLVFEQDDLVRIVMRDGSLILLSPTSIEEKDADGNLTKEAQLTRYSFLASYEGWQLELVAFSGDAKTEFGIVGEFLIPLDKTQSIEFE